MAARVASRAVRGRTGCLRGPVERVQWTTALRVLLLGCNVVLDWGLWSRPERDHYRTQARAMSASVVLCVLDSPIEELWQRLSRRNHAAQPGTFEITRAALERASRLFQRPEPDELALFDPL
ncbi:AAA family ATPase [Amycolatopsis taiwanensis]|uniref:AAA family ATPase n=1 Tax=Amycolatopsis taiwanensis TaxID=342230 RepID=UPI0025524AE7|nr:AAA family ATPase [Amycolatopsis taiwanensis]